MTTTHSEDCTWVNTALVDLAKITGTLITCNCGNRQTINIKVSFDNNGVPVNADDLVNALIKHLHEQCITQIDTTIRQGATA